MNYRLKMNKRYLVRHLNYIRKNILNLLLPVGPTYHISSLHLSPIPLPPPLFSFLPPLVSFLPVSLYTVRPFITDAQTGQKKQYTSTFRNFVPNFPVSAILVLPVFSRIFQYLQYSYFGNA